MPRLYKPKPRSNKNPDGSWRVTLPNIRKVVKSLSRPYAVIKEERDRDARALREYPAKDRHNDLERIIKRLEKQAGIKKESKKRGKTAR